MALSQGPWYVVWGIKTNESHEWACHSPCSFYHTFSSILSSWFSHFLPLSSWSFTIAPSSPSWVSYSTLLAIHSSFSAPIPPLLHPSSVGFSCYHHMISNTSLLSLSKQFHGHIEIEHCNCLRASWSSYLLLRRTWKENEYSESKIPGKAPIRASLRTSSYVHQTLGGCTTQWFFTSYVQLAFELLTHHVFHRRLLSTYI